MQVAEGFIKLNLSMLPGYSVNFNKEYLSVSEWGTFSHMLHFHFIEQNLFLVVEA